MGWNGSGNGKEVEKRGGGGQRRKNNSSVHLFSPPPPKFNYKALVAGLIVVIGGGIAAWMMTRGEKGETGEDVEKAKPSQIAEVEPAKVEPVVEEEEKKPKTYAEMTRDERLQYIRDMYGDNIPDNLKTTVYFLENPPQRTYHPSPSKFGFLKHRSERTIAEMLAVRPGTLIIRQPRFDERFDEEFQAAAIEKVEILADDTDEVREIKAAVQATKEDLIARVKAGEKASDIMNAEGKALYELGMYAHQLQCEIGKVSNDPNATDDDVQDIVDAANKMLGAKGAEPLRSPNFLLRQTSLAVAAERRKQKESQNKDKKGE